ncbi:MAG: LacI family DNA-binding transcriptional regulator [Cyclobacteriaceae bacterium]|nr:LacI family DNA-binding transcriptional regulator [Cyclobacteriaceae bacterium]
MKRERATIHDIAKKLDITASTVSRALKDHPRISEATKKAVLKEAKNLNYQPNHIAAALRIGRSKIIGIIVPTADRSFFSSVVRGIEEIANASQYNVMICQSYDIFEKEVATIEALINARVDGIIASYAKGTESFDHFIKVKDKGIPLILFDRSNEDIGVSNVILDDYRGAYEAVNHLIKQRCKRIAHLTGIKKISIYNERFRGYREALLDNGLSFDESLVIESDMQLEDGIESMKKLLSLPVLPDAVFAASDYSAMGAMQALKERNIRIPEDIALVGFGNEPFTRFSEPQLTTVDQRSKEMGNATAEIFLEQVGGLRKPFVPKKTVLKPELIIRKSSLKKG